MKKLTYLLVVLLCAACSNPKTIIIEESLRYCEAVYTFGDKLLISNFGSEELNPLNRVERNGYIMQWDGNSISEFVPSNNKMYAPKGMIVVGDYLYVADVNCVHIIKYGSEGQKTITMPFPSESQFINHFELVGDMLLVTCTNTQHVYALELKDDGSPSISGWQIYLYIEGANGLLYNNGKLYIASYNPSGTPDENNVIYVVDDLQNPQPRKLIDRIGQYDGLAIKGNWLYFTDWVGAVVGKVNLNNTKNIEIIDIELETPLVGPAEIDFYGDYLAIPDLPNSRVVLVEVK